MNLESATPAAPPAFMFRAFRYRNYRLFFSGQILSLVGSWMTDTASAWLVYRLTGSAWALGLVAFAGQIPSLLLSAVAGVFVDRWNQHRLLILTQSLLMAQSLTLGVLTKTGLITIPLLVTFNVVQGIVIVFDMPCRQAFVVRMIEDKRDLGNAIALNSSMFNLARLLGPSIAGVLIASAGEAWCFLIDGFSFLAVIAALLAMRVTGRESEIPRGEGAWKAMREGAAYTFGFPPIRAIIILMGLVCLVGIPYGVLMPVFASEILHGGPHTLGLLMTASGCGALCSALWLAARRSVLGLGKVIAISGAAFGLALMAFTFSKTLWLSAALIAVAGASFMAQMASSNSILQTIVEDNMRGRVISFFMLAFLGTAPFGSLLAGNLAEKIGAPLTVRIGGACCVLGAIFFARFLPVLREHIRPIYRRMGILPEVAAGIQSASTASTPPRT